jgi:probable F420-dependent oxidoreductase
MPGAPHHRYRRFRFGLQVRNAPDGVAWRDLARRAEASGFSTLMLPDHFEEAWSPTVPLTVAAEATSTLRVGALVYDNDYRHPLVLARDMAALDLLSSGRVEFGLGAGWMTTDYEQSGIALDPPAVRISRMEEALTVITRLWHDDAVDFDGAHYRLAGARCFPRPHTPGGPPIVIGGGGKRVLTVAARHASIIGVNPELTSGVAGADAAKTAIGSRYDERIAWVREAAGERFSSIELQVLCQVEMITPDREALYESMAPLFGLTPEQAREVPIVLAGSVEQICDDLVARRERFGFSYIVVHDLEAMAPVVARLAGT